MARTHVAGPVRKICVFALTAALAIGVAGVAEAAEVAVSQPIVSDSVATFGKVTTFSAVLAPGEAAVFGARLNLYRLETKTLTTWVRGVRKRTSVNYWRLRTTLPMQAAAGAVAGASADATPVAPVVARLKMPYAGNWQAQVVYSGSPDYDSCTSTVATFVVKDPRIERAIHWAMHRRGSHAWDHHCLKFVSDAYQRGAGAVVRRFDTAKLAATALHASANKSLNAPRGAYVFYDSKPGHGNPGHVGISLGGGKMINSYGSSPVQILPIKLSMHYIGWAAPPLSPALTDWLTRPAG
jgi:cell wall-associated NlpC family hydrolase